MHLRRLRLPRLLVLGVALCALAFALLCFATSCAAHFLSRSLSTWAAKTSHLPSGDHTNSPTPRFWKVTWRASPPLTPITHIWGLPERSEIKAISSPEGDQRGTISRRGLLVNLRASALPSAGTSQILDA